MGTIILSSTYIVASVIYFLLLNKRLKRWGLIRINLDKKFFKLILESIGAIKNIILNDLSRKFSTYFENHNKI